jgi:16S rRNA (cytidine1402-2'-O)-methyltransferase
LETSQNESAQPAAELDAGLYVVATPIGNLEDITLRALRVLRNADLIACEDTRHTQKLLNHFEIKTKTQSYHQHNEASRAEELVERVAQGEAVALVSDAGMPGISDPGERVIQAAVRRGLPVIAVPGPSAMISALVASGLATDSFRFAGFLPARAGERRTALETLREAAETLILYEAPHRLLESLADLQTAFGSGRQIVVARELTKMHEELLRGSISEVLALLSTRESIKGEITLIISGKSPGSESQTRRTLQQRMKELLESESMDENSALKRAAREFGVSKSEAYREWQRVRKSKSPVTSR